MLMTTSSLFSVPNVSIGSLLGTTATAGLVASINESLTGMSSGFLTAVNDRMAAARDVFVKQVLQPIQLGGEALIKTVNILMNPDVIRPLIDLDDFRAIPPCMYESIIMFAPVKSLLEQEKISGFGFDPRFLPKEDVWGRLISNGTVKDVLGSADENGDVWFEWRFKSTDPDASFEDLDAVEATRDAIRQLLKNTRVDPTDPMEVRG